MKKILLLSLAVIVLGIGTFASVGKMAPLSWQLWGDVNQESGIGSGGYDVVSYHTPGEPVAGDEEISSRWKDTTWLFSSVANKELFDSNPERYAPSYGGFCAYAVLNNFSADINPNSWHLENGNLYLFASDGPRKAWIAEMSNGAINKSDANWEQR